MEFSLELYDIDVVNQQYVRKDVINQFKTCTFDFAENSFGLARITISGYSPKMFDGNIIRYRTIVAIKMNKTIIWTGTVEDFSEELRNVSWDIILELSQFGYRLNNRLTNLNVRYDQIGQGQIAWDLINTNQNKAGHWLGITQGETETSFLRDRSYSYNVIGQMIENLTEVIGGFNFEFRPVVDAEGLLIGHSFNTFLPRGSERFDLPGLVLGSTVMEASVFTQKEIRNKIVYKGAGTGEESIYSETQDNNSMNAYTALEYISSRDSITEKASLDEWSQKTLADSIKDKRLMKFLMKPNSNLDPFSFQIGDTLRLNISIQEAPRKYIGTAKVISKSFQISPQGVLGWMVTVEHITSNG